jgi:hypothetical protein
LDLLDHVGNGTHLFDQIGSHRFAISGGVVTQPIYLCHDCRRMPLELGLHSSNQARPKLVNL